MTPQQIQDALQAQRMNDAYGHGRDEILGHISQAYAEMRQAVAKFTVLESRIATGDMQGMASKHQTMKEAMAGQNAIIQAAFVECAGVLENAQEVVYGVTGGRFIPGVPLPEPPVEPEPEP